MNPLKYITRAKHKAIVSRLLDKLDKQWEKRETELLRKHRIEKTEIRTELAAEHRTERDDMQKSFNAEIRRMIADHDRQEIFRQKRFDEKMSELERKIKYQDSLNRESEMELEKQKKLSGELYGVFESVRSYNRASAGFTGLMAHNEEKVKQIMEGNLPNERGDSIGRVN